MGGEKRGRKEERSETRYIFERGAFSARVAERELLGGL